MLSRKQIWIVALLLTMPIQAIAAKEADLAHQAVGFLRKYCYACHGVSDEAGTGFHILSKEILLSPAKGLKPAYVAPGNAEGSLIWQMISDRSMPDKYAVQGQHPIPTDAERAVVKKWIEQGAKFPIESERAFVSDQQMLGSMLEDLGNLAKQSELFPPKIRYLVFANLHRSTSVSNEQLALARAATSKLLNSLSWQPKIKVPMLVDSNMVIMRINLDDYGWSAEDWRRLVKVYPYGVNYEEDAAAQMQLEGLKKKTGERQPFLRGDWFVANASRPPLYTELLRLPATATELETLLGVKLETAVREFLPMRAGLIHSDVSRHNRAMDRFETKFGAYWRSYDFNSSDQRGNILQRPLGPFFTKHPFESQAFVEAGGELIFNLPNGLQAYMLVDGKGVRLDAPAPISIVRDLRETSGTPEIVNGISCIACHNRGIKRFKNEVRNNWAVYGDALRAASKMYLSDEELEKHFLHDEKRFQDSEREAISSLLKTDKIQVDVTAIEEPVFLLTRAHAAELNLEQAAADLGMDAKVFKTAIEHNPNLRELGLAPLLVNGSIKRELWERVEGLSLFQQAAGELGFSGRK